MSVGNVTARQPVPIQFELAVKQMVNQFEKYFKPVLPRRFLRVQVGSIKLVNQERAVVSSDAQSYLNVPY